MKKFLLSIIVAGLISGMGYAIESQDPSHNQPANIKNTTAIKEGVITVPAGELFRCAFMSPVSSETAFAGQEITLAIVNDFYYNNALIAPAGSTVTGSVIEVAKAKHGSVNAKLTLRFTHIMTPVGTDIPISAVIQTYDKTGTLIGGKGIGLNSAESSINMETINENDYLPPYQGIKLGSTPAMTTAVRTGGGGLLKSIWDKGEEVEIPVNTRIDLILIQPITINPMEY